MRYQFCLYGLVGLVVSGSGTALVLAHQTQPPTFLVQNFMQMGWTDQSFIEMMIPHHQDAVDMANLALKKGQHPEIKNLAQIIIRDQQREIQQMELWYQQWFGQTVPPLSTHGMMGMHRGGYGMMGIDLKYLETATNFDQAFIRQMIPHHQMAVMMASNLKTNTNHPEMDKLADDIIQSQSTQIKEMKQWYQVWYGP
jgi:uncharacterized protein (DUF305 family)